MFFLCYDEPMATFGNLGAQSGITRAPSYGNTAPGGADAADENAPVFVRGIQDLIEYTTPMGQSRAGVWCFYFSLTAMALYTAAFCAAESWFPGLYRAWVDAFLPLVELAGSLTPRDDRVMAALISHGYLERAEFAQHSIAMLRVLALPTIVSALLGFIGIKRMQETLLVVSCTRKTPVYIFLSAIGLCVIWLVLVGGAELWASEDFISPSRADYYASNSAMAIEVCFAWMWGMTPAAFLLIAITWKTHYHIVEKALEEKQ